MSTAKYVKTEDNNIIIFSKDFNHSQFKYFHPVSAGFIVLKYYKQSDGTPTAVATCYGESLSLDLKSAPEDSELATVQILDRQYY